MRDWTDLKPPIGIGVLLGLGWVLVAFNTVRAIQSNASVYSRVVGVAIPFVLAVALFAGAVGIRVYGLYDQAFRIAVWTVLGTAAVTFAAAVNVLGFGIVQPDFSLALYMIVNAAAGGAVLGFLIGLYDAHQSRLVENLVLETEKAQALSQRLSVLNRVLRHDIRNQAQIIQSHTERLQHEDYSPAEAATHIRDANQRLTDLSDDARELQALLTGDECTRTRVDMVSAVREAGDAVRHSHPDLHVEYDLPETLEASAPPLIEQAIEHLLYNVVEHNDSPEPRAEIGLTAERSSPPVVRLTISDNGPGIPETEPLLSDASDESQLQHSSGIGLWFVKWIVDEADGDLEIETPDSGEIGTVVTVTLPTPPS